MKPSKKWRAMQPIYQAFAEGKEGLDFSEEAAEEMYLFESRGEGNLRMGLFSGERMNGYAVGKHWMDATVKGWLEMIAEGTLFIWELYEWFPEWHWWLDRVVKAPLERRHGHHVHEDV